MSEKSGTRHLVFRLRLATDSFDGIKSIFIDSPHLGNHCEINFVNIPVIDSHREGSQNSEVILAIPPFFDTL